MNAEEFITLNNEKRPRLTKENEKIYGDILAYVRLSNVEELEAEILLMDLLDHLLEAQEHGKTAEDVFGKDPRAFCKDLLANLPKNNTGGFIKLLAPSVWIGVAMLIFTNASDGVLAYSWITLTGIALDLLLFLFLLSQINKIVFLSHKKAFVGMFLTFVGFMVLNVGMLWLDHTYGKVLFALTDVPLYLLLTLVGISLLISMYRLSQLSGVLVGLFFIAANVTKYVPIGTKGEKLVVNLILLGIAMAIPVISTIMSRKSEESNTIQS